MLSFSKNQRNKAMISVLFATGFRADEFLLELFQDKVIQKRFLEKVKESGFNKKAMSAVR